MIKTMSRSGYRLAVVGVAGALLLGACSSGNGGTSDGDDGTVGFVNLEDAGDPVDGGEPTFGSFSFPNSLDPTQTQVAGATGGTEMAAMYDVLLRAEDGEFVPQLAESLEGNDDFTEFTITLRDGVTFSDGSVLDADAVKWSIDRFVEAGADVAQAWAGIVEEISTPDQSTVKFTLKNSWDDFPVLLAMGPGLIVGEGSDAGDSFTPIGAGPFTLEKFAPSEELVLASRPDYFGGEPPLDKLRFVPTQGAQGALESLQSGQLNMAYFNIDEAVIQDVQDAEYSGYFDNVGLGAFGTINNREGRPGADVRVRQAIAYGIDPEVLKDRVGEGIGVASSEILPDSSAWYTGVEGIEFDPEKAKSLLDEAKADGYDGKLSYLAFAQPRAQASALSVQGQLNAIGFDVTIDTAGSVTDLIRKQYIESDFDIVRSSGQFMDEAPYLRLYSALGSDSADNSSGYVDAEMDELLADLQTATTDDDKRDLMDKIQERVNETSPFAIWAPSKIFVAWDSDIHGVKRSADNIMLFDTTWVEN